MTNKLPDNNSNNHLVEHIQQALNQSLKEGYERVGSGERCIEDILDDVVNILSVKYKNVFYDEEVSPDKIFEGGKHIRIENGVIKLSVNNENYYFGYRQRRTTNDDDPIYSFTRFLDIFTEREYFKPTIIYSFKIGHFTIDIMSDDKATIKNGTIEKTFPSVEMATDFILNNHNHNKENNDRVFSFTYKNYQISVYENDHASIVFEGKVRNFITPEKAIFFIDKNA